MDANLALVEVFKAGSEAFAMQMEGSRIRSISLAISG
jgi:hypothetical protein